MSFFFPFRSIMKASLFVFVALALCATVSQAVTVEQVPSTMTEKQSVCILNLDVTTGSFGGAISGSVSCDTHKDAPTITDCAKEFKDISLHTNALGSLNCIPGFKITFSNIMGTTESDGASWLSKLNAVCKTDSKVGTCDGPACLLKGTKESLSQKATSTATFTKCEHRREKDSCTTSKPCDCVVRTYSYGACTGCEGDGQHATRTRTPLDFDSPMNGGAACPTSEVVACEPQDVVLCPVDCQLSGWTPDRPENTPCTLGAGSKCGDGFKIQTREILKQGANGGKSCTGEALVTETPCHVDCPCDKTTIGDWSKCSKECGSGIRTATKTVAKSDGSVCEKSVISEPCNTQTCNVDCIVSDWNFPTFADAPCTKPCGEGTRTRNRTITTPAQADGQACPHLVEVEPCNTQACPVDCKLSEFGEWDVCDTACGPGTQSRFKTVITPAAHGGKACGETVESRACKIMDCQCKTSEWGAFSECSKACGSGQKTRTRTVTQQPTGEVTCPDLSETVACNTQECDVNCQVGQWTSWSDCSEPCGEGHEYRSRVITVEKEGNGESCPKLDEVRECFVKPCPINCQLSEWSTYSNCSAICGVGTMIRTRTVVHDAQHGGTPCGDLAENKDCDAGVNCEKCVVSSWSDFSACSKTCGSGTQKRTRTVTTRPTDGSPCPNLEEDQACNVHPCAQDCKVSDFGPWGTCSETCGGGTQARRRSIVQEPKNGGALCPPLLENRDCNTDLCDATCLVVGTPVKTALQPEVKHHAYRICAPLEGKTEYSISYKNTNEKSHGKPMLIPQNEVMKFSFNFTTDESGSAKLENSILERIHIVHDNDIDIPAEYELSVMKVSVTSPPKNETGCQHEDWTQWSPCRVNCDKDGEYTHFRVRKAKTASATCKDETQAEKCTPNPNDPTRKVTPVVTITAADDGNLAGENGISIVKTVTRNVTSGDACHKFF